LLYKTFKKKKKKNDITGIFFFCLFFVVFFFLQTPYIIERTTNIKTRTKEETTEIAPLVSPGAIVVGESLTSFEHL